MSHTKELALCASEREYTSFMCYSFITLNLCLVVLIRFGGCHFFPIACKTFSTSPVSNLANNSLLKMQDRGHPFRPGVPLCKFPKFSIYHLQNNTK